VTRSGSLLAHALGAVARRGRKSLALGGGLAFAVALLAAVLFMTDALRAETERARAAQPDVVVQRLVGGRPSTLRAEDANKIRDIAAVRAVTPRVWGYVFLPSLQGNITVVGARAGAPPISVADGVLAEGRDLTPGAHEMIVGAELAKFLGLRPGDVLGLPSPNPDAPALKLVGTFRASLDMFTADVVICDDEDARALLSMPAGDATDLAVSVSNSAETRVVARTIGERIPGARVIERELLARVHHLAYGRRAGLVLAASLPALLALLVLAWDRASGVGPDERREIAVLKACGWSTSDVLAVKLAESLIVGAAATALGLVLGYAWVFWLGAPGLRPALVGWSVLYPRAPLTPTVGVSELLGISLAVLGPFALLSVLPAWRASQADPLDVMRG
jgi:ABC-type lipoprotein release transport system permease subunit